MAKIRNYSIARAISHLEFMEPILDSDTILGENEALRQLIAEIKLQCDLLRERLPSKATYH